MIRRARATAAAAAVLLAAACTGDGADEPGAGVTVAGRGPSGSTGDGSVVGTVSHDGEPVRAATVSAYAAKVDDELPAVTVRTRADGSYALTGLRRGGDWVVCVDTDKVKDVPGTGLVAECSLDAPQRTFGFPDDVTPVRVEPGRTTKLDVRLGTAGAVSGRVTRDGAPLVGVTVTVRDEKGGSVARDDTDASGRYRATGVPPSTAGYVVCMSTVGQTSGSASATSGCSPDVAYRSSGATPGARRVRVVAGVTSDGVDIAARADLTAATVVTGTVLGRDGPLRRMDVQLFGVGTGSRSALTNPRGVYRFTGVDPAGGPYTVCAAPADYARVIGRDGRCAGGVHWPGPYTGPDPPTGATRVPVVPGGTTRLDVELPARALPDSAPGRLVGDVIGADGGRPDVGVNVFTLPRADGKSSTVLSSGTSDGDARYEIHDLPVGRYLVCVWPGTFQSGSAPTGYGAMCHGGVAWTTSPEWDGHSDVALPAGATPVEVGPGTTRLDLTVPLGGAVTGVVRVGERPAPHVTVYVWPAGVAGTSGTLPSTTDTTDAAGRFRIASLTPRPDGYLVCLATSEIPGPDRSRCWRSAPWDPAAIHRAFPADAEPVQVTAGQRTELTFSLDPPDGGDGAAIRGTVTAAANGGVLPGTVITVRGDHGVDYGRSSVTDDGTYRITGVPAGTYRVCADASVPVEDHAVPDPPFRLTCRPVTVRRTDDTAHVDLAVAAH